MLSQVPISGITDALQTNRDEIEDPDEALINSLVTQGKISEPEEDTLFDRIYMFGRWCVGGLIQGACAS